MPVSNPRSKSHESSATTAAAAALVEAQMAPSTGSATSAATSQGSGQPQQGQGPFVSYSGPAAQGAWGHDQWVAAQGMAGLKEGVTAQQGSNLALAYRGSAAAAAPNGIQPMYMPGGMASIGWGGHPQAAVAQAQAAAAAAARGVELNTLGNPFPPVAGQTPPKQRSGTRAGKVQSGTKGKGMRSNTASLAIEVPLSCQGPGELGWHPELLTMSTINLNDFVTKNRLKPDEIKALKSLRRRIKNRGYTQKARSRARNAVTPSESPMASDTNAEVASVSVQCQPDVHTQGTQTESE